MGYNICKTSAFSNNRKERVGLKIMHVIIKFYVLMDCQTMCDVCDYNTRRKRYKYGTSHIIEKNIQFSFSNSELQIAYYEHRSEATS